MKNIYLGQTLINSMDREIEGEFIKFDGEKFYKISNYNLMPDFFMTIVSDSDHWMFISSNGSLSAGRKDRDNALFPYYTDDKIHDYCGITGSKSILIIENNNKRYLWEPFSKDLSSIYNIERNIYKSIYGNKIIFEEINNDLGVSFQYAWSYSEQFGFIKKSEITNQSDASLKVELLDGITNILPAGVYYSFQNEYSNLLDGYKKNELQDDTGLGLFMLSAIPVDKAEPSESLNSTTVWCTGLSGHKTLLSNQQLDNFKNGLAVTTETDVKAQRGSYFVGVTLELRAQDTKQWMTVAEINQSTTDVANLNNLIRENNNLDELIDKDIHKGTENLIKVVASADGIQTSNEELLSARHFSNTLFNIMRGGTYLDNYSIEKNDVSNFIKQTNFKIGRDFQSLIEKFPEKLSNQTLLDLANETSNADLIRICYEYLPLTFSRRHGDPSRPWNLFSIENKNEDGTPKSDYQGNWRDIFQNWEALSLSYPGFIENIICKFVNASTADGYNPYRIMRNGIDWECPDHDDPWAYIGYWGDHQIIYLQKLLELSNNYHPGKINELLTSDIFAYANVPYRIKSYAEIVKDPQNTIDFDHTLNQQIQDQVPTIGTDARLLMGSDSNFYHVNLTEKRLVSLLTKLSNFIPEAGIWLNTQRPEWNDANNALVGNGVSMVTLCYIRRFLKFWHDKFDSMSDTDISISTEVKTLLDSISHVFSTNISILATGFSDGNRRLFADTLGQAGSAYRDSIYKNSFSGDRKVINSRELTDFTTLVLKYIDQSIDVNRRDDGLYHAYNLIQFNENGVSIRHLYEMLEGQVAVLSSGYLNVEQCNNVLDSLKSSKLFRQDQYSYLLYPDRELARFTDKNNISAERVTESELLSKLLADDERSIIRVDNSGNYHFSGKFRNADFLKLALESLDKSRYGTLVEKEKSQVLDIYEEIFDHQSYTGRSGTFYAYEGLGSIYWHMVSKLRLAVKESFFHAVDKGADPANIGKMKSHYYEIKAGIGLYKTPELYGAFPTDAYSHTIRDAGVKQPGMTGQVKEDVISRMGELGVRVRQGRIIFNSRLFHQQEFITQKKIFNYHSVDGEKENLDLNPEQIGFTLCQVPVIYTVSDQEKITLSLDNGHKEEIMGNSINQHFSSLIFNRKSEVKLIEVSVKNY